MLQKKLIKYTSAAVDDLDEIFSYIAKDNVFAAEKLLMTLSSKISQLADFPNLGTVLSDEKYTIIERGYRFIVVQPYLVFYRIIGDSIIIHRLLHGRRDYLRELFDEFQVDE